MGSESDSSEMDRLQLSDTESESSGKKHPPKLKEEVVPRKENSSKNSSEHKDRSNNNNSRSESKKDAISNSSRKSENKSSSKKDQIKGKSERDKLIDKKMSKIFGSSSDEDEPSNVDYRQAKTSVVSTPGKPSTAPIAPTNNLLMPATSRSISLEHTSSITSKSKPKQPKVKASSMFDTDSSDDEVSVALKKSVDAMTTSGTTSAKQQVNPLSSNTSSIKMGHLPTI